MKIIAPAGTKVPAATEKLFKELFPSSNQITDFHAMTEISGIVSMNGIVGFDTAKLISARKMAQRLAAAYYVATYSPEMHNEGSKSVLYSFPWIVAADVIACGLAV